MRISAQLTDSPKVARALVAMATPINVELASSMGFDPPAAAAPNDLLVALETDDDALAEALTSLDAALHEPGAGARPSTEELAPCTTASAARVQPAGLALVSTPGPHAFVEAMDALDAGLSVMVFSDNVPLAQEVRLKEHAASRGLLVMGPDCGTAVVAGVGLGFATVVRPGIAAFSIGTSSQSGPREMTKPPVCCERWRGKPRSICASSSH
jgi:FdrA protein